MSVTKKGLPTASSKKRFDPQARFRGLMAELNQATADSQKGLLLNQLSAEERRLERRSPGIHDLIRIVWLLNSNEPARELLKQLVAKWQDSGPNLEKLFAPPIERGSTLQEIKKEEENLRNAKLWRDLRASVAYELKPTKTGRAAVQIVPRPQRGISTAQQTALWMFALLITNPQWEKLGGPCRNANCGKFYVKKTIRPGTYCSRACAWDTTARVATTRTRQREREKRLDRAISLCKEWKNTRTSKSWKQWVAGAGRKEGITSNFLTIAVRKGELIPPTKAAN
jgi:hypothetical protein